MSEVRSGVDILSAESAGGRAGRASQEVEIDLVAKQTVEVSSGQRVVPGKFLLETGFKRAHLLRLEIGVGDHGKTTAVPERLRETGLLDASGVAEAEARAGKEISSAQGGEPQRNSRHRFVSETLVVNKARAGHDGETPQGQKLLPVHSMVQAHTMTKRIGQAAGSPVLIFEFISDRGLRPTSFGVIALIVEAGTIDVGDGMEWSVDLIAERVHSARLIYGLDVGTMQRILEALETMLPARGPRYGQLRARQQIVLACALVEVRRQDRISVEIPVALHAGSAIGVAGTQTESRPVSQLHSDVAAFQRV